MTDEAPDAPSPERLAKRVTQEAVEAHVRHYLDNYEMLCEDARGHEGYYRPTPREVSIVDDAVEGLFNDETSRLVHANWSAEIALRRAESRCERCGAPAGTHWGIQCEEIPGTEVNVGAFGESF